MEHIVIFTECIFVIIIYLYLHVVTLLKIPSCVIAHLIIMIIIIMGDCTIHAIATSRHVPRPAYDDVMIITITHVLCHVTLNVLYMY